MAAGKFESFLQCVCADVGFTCFKKVDGLLAWRYFAFLSAMFRVIDLIETFDCSSKSPKIAYL